MRRRTIALLSTATMAAAAGITGAVIWASQPSYDDTVRSCQKALATQYENDGKGKPDACEGVKSDDYDALVLNAAMNDLGWTDDDGNFDESKMLDSTP